MGSPFLLKIGREKRRKKEAFRRQRKKLLADGEKELTFLGKNDKIGLL